MGVEVVRLTSGPFTAARGRDAGVKALLKRQPELEFVQFVDGDCMIDEQWLPAAAGFLREHDLAAVVAGRLRERYAKENVLIRLVDVEWDLPTGRTDAVGGIFLARMKALQQVGGWKSELIAGEELDLSARLIAAGWEIHRLEREMTLHDVGIRRLGEFWRRAVRTGHAYAELGMLHGERCGRWRRRTRSYVGYGIGLPLVIVLAALLWWPMAAVLALAYPLLVVRLARWRVRRGDPIGLAVLYGLSAVMCKIAGGIGAARYFAGRLLKRPSALMEYKRPATARTGGGGEV
jgi:hypothetical protein